MDDPDDADDLPSGRCIATETIANTNGRANGRNPRRLPRRAFGQGSAVRPHPEREAVSERSWLRDVQRRLHERRHDDDPLRVR